MMGQNHSIGLASKSRQRQNALQIVSESGPGPSHTWDPPTSFREALPLELLLHIFSSMSLKTLIAAGGVCKDWRRSVPLASVHLTRRRLYQLFYSMANNPQLTKTRKWTVDHLRPFNRQWFLDALVSQCGAVPEEFGMWILEWPAKLAIGSLWPGLPFAHCQVSTFQRTYGVNWLGHAPPQLSAVVYQYKERRAKYVPGLLLWRGDFDTTTCSVDESSSVIAMGYMQRSSIRFGGKDSNGVFADWITYQEHEWEQIVVEITAQPAAVRVMDTKLTEKYRDTAFYWIDINPGGQVRWELPCPPWMRRHEEEFVRYLNSTV